MLILIFSPFFAIQRICQQTTENAHALKAKPLATQLILPHATNSTCASRARSTPRVALPGWLGMSSNLNVIGQTEPCVAADQSQNVQPQHPLLVKMAMSFILSLALAPREAEMENVSSLTTLPATSTRYGLKGCFFGTHLMSDSSKLLHKQVQVPLASTVSDFVYSDLV